MNQLIFISFSTVEDDYHASIALQDVLSSNFDIETSLKDASNVYRSSLQRISKLLSSRADLINQHQIIPARLIWNIGDQIFSLNENLAVINFQIDNLYSHLIRDLNLNRKWLEKVVILRRYIPTIELLPENINWGWFEKGTRKKIYMIWSQNSKK